MGRRQAPWVATWLVGLCIAVIALLTDFAALSNMVSIGTFVVFGSWRCRCRGGGCTCQAPARPAVCRKRCCTWPPWWAARWAYFVRVWTLPLYNTVDGVRCAWADHQWKLVADGVLHRLLRVSMMLHSTCLAPPQSRCIL